MDLQEYQKLAARTAASPSNAANRRFVMDRMTGMPLIATKLYHAALGLSSEAGEFASEIEKWLHFGKDLNKQAIIGELGDILWYMALACNALGINMATLPPANIAKLQARFPEKFDGVLVQHESRDLDKEQQAMQKALQQEVLNTPTPPITIPTEPRVQDGHGWAEPPDGNI